MKLVVRAALFAGLTAFTALAASITVTPNNESVVVGGTKQMTATVSGLANTAVAWSADAGGISASGLYSAPASIPLSGIANVTATSMMDGSVMGTAVLKIMAVGPVISDISPKSLPLNKVFTLVVTGSGFAPDATVWNGSVQLTTVSTSATQLKATGTATQLGNMILRARNANSMFSNIITYVNVVSSSGSGSKLTVAPATTTVPTGATQQFSASYNGASAAVTWSATAGTISASGLYTAPAAVPPAGSATITAAGPNNTSATAMVSILSSTPPQIKAVAGQPIPIGIFTTSVTGNGFTPTSQASFSGTVLTTQYLSPTQLTVMGFAGQNGLQNLTVANGPIASAPFSVQVGLPNPLVSASAARRFLQQAAFGPTAADALHVQQIGFDAWIDEQLAMPSQTSYQIAGNQGGLSTHWLTSVTMNPDQLRQRVAFALSQIFVTSITKLLWNQEIAPYEDMVLADAFVSYRKLLSDVTLSPAMGKYLDMANNGKANALGTVLPNENYSREVLQLLSLGTSLLNPDGTPQLDAQSNPIATYNQKTITELARVFTGWTYAPTTPGGPVIWNAYGNPNSPMVPYPAQHDFGSKTLWTSPVSAVIPASLSPQMDLDAALDAIVAHPNNAPFMSKQLIQHLVKSNPTPAYVARISAVFQQSGGNLGAVVKAILLDSEARAYDNGGVPQTSDGHLQEPGLFLAGLFRGLGAQVNDQNYFAYDLRSMSQDIFNSPSVFNFYSPQYVVPGTGITGGEFQIFTPATSVYRANLVANIFSAYSNYVQTYGPGLTVDFTPYVSLASNPAQLVGALDVALTCGQMPVQMKQIITTAVQNESGGSLRRVQTALYLIAASGYYNVWF